MKAHLPYSIILWQLLLAAACGSPPARSEADWKKEPLLISIDKSAQGIMAEYEAWSEDWAKGDKRPTEKDQTINRITEEFFITLMNALAVSPNPELFTQSTRFLDTKVPSEFDGTWRFVLIEFSNVAKGADGRRLHSEHLENLKKRALKSK